MRILAVNHEYTVSGASRLLLALARHLRGTGHTVSISAANPAPGPLRDAFHDDGFVVLDPPFAGWFDLAVCNTIATAPIVNVLGGATKTLWWVNEGEIGLDLLFANPDWRTAFARATAIVFANDFQAESMFRSFIWPRPAERTFVIPNGIPPIVPPLDRQPPDGTIRVAVLGNVVPRKRQDDLIRAVAALRPQPIRCVVIGKIYDLPADCRRLIAEDPATFELRGELAHAEALAELARADIFSLPSGSEAMPLAMLEAAMLGIPMILSDLPVHAALWRHGVNCLMHPIGDVGLLAQSIAWLAADPDLRRRLGHAARHTAAPFTEAAMLARFDAILAGL